MDEALPLLLNMEMTLTLLDYDISVFYFKTIEELDTQYVISTSENLYKTIQRAFYLHNGKFEDAIYRSAELLRDYVNAGKLDLLDPVLTYLQQHYEMTPLIAEYIAIKYGKNRAIAAMEAYYPPEKYPEIYWKYKAEYFHLQQQDEAFYQLLLKAYAGQRPDRQVQKACKQAIYTYSQLKYWDLYYQYNYLKERSEDRDFPKKGVQLNYNDIEFLKRAIIGEWVGADTKKYRFGSYPDQAVWYLIKDNPSAIRQLYAPLAVRAFYEGKEELVDLLKKWVDPTYWQPYAHFFEMMQLKKQHINTKQGYYQIWSSYVFPRLEPAAAWAALQAILPFMRQCWRHRRYGGAMPFKLAGFFARHDDYLNQSLMLFRIAKPYVAHSWKAGFYVYLNVRIKLHFSKGLYLEEIPGYIQEVMETYKRFERSYRRGLLEDLYKVAGEYGLEELFPLIKKGMK